MKESERRIHEMLENVELVAVMLDVAGRVTFCNNFLLQLTGRTRAETIGCDWFENFLPPGSDGVRQMFLEALHSGEMPAQYENEIVAKAGALRSIRWNNTVIRDPDGTITGATSLGEDITERKRAEAERQKFVMLADNSSEFIGMCDLDMTPLYVNPAGIRMVGLLDMASACRVKVQDYYFPEDQAFIRDDFFPRVLREGRGEVEIRLRHFQTGEAIWMFYSLFQLRDARGAVVGWATVSRDISERKLGEAKLIESERSYRALFENMSSGFVLFEVVQDEQGTPVDLIILAANQGFEATTGLKQAEVTGKRLTQVLPGIEKDAADWIGTFGKVALTGEHLQLEQGSELLGYFYAITAYQAGPKQCAVNFTDITERKQAEAKLVESEHRYRALFENMSAGFVLFEVVQDEQGAPVDLIILAANQGFEATTGLKQAEVTGKRLTQVLPGIEKDTTDWIGIYGKVALTGEPQQLEQWSELLETCYSITVYQSGPKQCAIIFTDVSERKRAVTALKVNEARLNNILQTSLDGFWRADWQGRILEVNLAYCQMSGYSERELLALTIPDLEAAESAPETAAHLVKIKSLGKDRFESRHRRKDGTVFDVEISVQSNYGAADEMVVFIRDITERKSAEELLHRSQAELKAITDNVPATVALVDRDGKMVYINRAPGGGSTVDLIGLSVIDTAPPGYETVVRAAHEKVLATQEPETFRVEFEEGNALFGDRIVLEAHTGPVIVGGEMVGVVHVTHDVTQQAVQAESLQSQFTKLKLAEAELEARGRELQHINAELERFLYTASHDLKSPVVTVRTFLSYLEQDMATADAERIAKDMDFIRAAADKMAQLLDDLLEISRIGRIVATPVKVTFRQLADEAVAAVAGLIAKGGVAVTVGDDEVELFGDRLRLAEVFQNLLENACKFMGSQPSPGITIGCETHATETVFFVRDNGIGLDPRHLAKVFGLFEKLDPQADGTGIGLAHVQRIVELNDGRIWVESPGVDQGACFYFTLPATLKKKNSGEQS